MSPVVDAPDWSESRDDFAQQSQYNIEMWRIQ
jgi:hypothetical protein